MARKTPLFEDLPSVPLSKLHLNPENPRHEPLRDEQAIIAQLYTHELMPGLLQDIAERGVLSPIERIGVVDMDGMPGHYVVVEGNRRVCALKLLTDPKLAPTPEAQRAITKLREVATPPKAVPVVRFRDHEAADPFIDLRHLGTQDGRGLKPWNASQKTRRAGQDSANALAVAVLDRAREGQWLSEGDRNRIAVTTLTRYLSNPVVRHALGLGSNRELLFTHDTAEVDRALQTLLNDALRPTDGSDPHALTSRSSKAQRQAYARGLADRGVAPSTALAQPVAPGPAAVPGAGAGAGPQPNRRHRTDADRRRLLEGRPVAARDPVVRRLVDELRVDTEGHEFAVNYLLRALVERALVLFATRHGIFKPRMPDKVLVQAVTKKLDDLQVPASEYPNLRKARDSPDATWSMDSLGHAVHGGLFPTRRDLNSAWNNWQPVVRLLLQMAEAP